MSGTARSVLIRLTPHQADALLAFLDGGPRPRQRDCAAILGHIETAREEGA